MAEETTIILATRMKPSTVIVPGSVKRTCSQCGKGVWLAPSGVKRMERSPCKIVCLDCIGLDFLLGQVEPITDEQLAEIERTVGKEEAREIKKLADLLSHRFGE